MNSKNKTGKPTKLNKMNKSNEQAENKPCTIHGVVCCAECKEQDLIEEAKREEYLHNLRWEENMNHLYTWDEGGFCDGFTNQ